jgi:hypothetical protein
MLSTLSSVKDVLCMVSVVKRVGFSGMSDEFHSWLWAERLAVLRGLGFLLFKVFIVSYGYGVFMVDKSMR